MNSPHVQEAKDYLVRMNVWDDDHWICANNIADKISGEWTDDNKYGRRAIIALCEVHAANVATVSPSDDGEYRDMGSASDFGGFGWKPPRNG